MVQLSHDINIYAGTAANCCKSSQNIVFIHDKKKLFFPPFSFHILDNAILRVISNFWHDNRYKCGIGCLSICRWRPKNDSKDNLLHQGDTEDSTVNTWSEARKSCF